MNVDLFDYELPAALIAQTPKVPRDASRLLVIDPDDSLHHLSFQDVVDQIPPGALLVFNDTRVIPARLYTVKETGGKVELLLTRGMGNIWQAIFKASRRPKTGDLLFLDPPVEAVEPLVVLESGTERELTLRLPTPGEPWDFLERYGHIPLPPYIERPDTADDRNRYQTVYAKNPGAIAAPTAGLHFTPRILDALNARGVTFGNCTLHVGIGTFTPIKVADTRDHVMHEEWFHIPKELAKA
ncbi:S-adenosylmethionine:tRNA ribosyltransferase-isomerase, partial [Myxococcota bacterium]|nr:S-adenosylmethionine:tRNA ribosyltransferase-isomerase [Myxococcota bacterium]